MIAAGEAHITQNTLFVAMGLVCGFTFPPSYLPDVLRWLGEALPMTSALRALRAATLQHAPLPDGAARTWCVASASAGCISSSDSACSVRPSAARCSGRGGGVGIETYDLRKVFQPRTGLLKRGGSPTVAVDGLTLSIPAGQITGLLGLNGAGKTTTIKVLATLLRPTQGSATVDGLDVVAHARRVRRRINLIAGGERMVYTRLTGRENLWYFGQLYDVPRSDLKPRIDRLLATVGLTDAADTLVERYSRGMRQRLSIARGLINEPAYLLLDEPTLGLDAPIARDLRAVVAGLADNGVGVLLTSHYLAEVEQLCRHVYVIEHGRLLRQGSPAELAAGSDLPHAVAVTVAEAPPALVAAVRELADRSGARLSEDLDPDGQPRLTLHHPEDLAGSLATTVVRAGGAIVTARGRHRPHWRTRSWP
jgi:ABC-2 type transport system ATP-binding protein